MKFLNILYEIMLYMLTGTDKDPNTCQYCNKSFSRANELAIHYQKKHLEVYGENKK